MNLNLFRLPGARGPAAEAEAAEVATAGKTEVEAYLDEAAAQRAEVAALVDALSPAAVAWSPAPARWSIAQHLAHLTLATRAYLATIDDAVARAREKGALGPGPYRHGRLGNAFVRSMEPPPKMRVRTMKALEPGAPGAAPARLGDFVAAQDALIASLRSARGVDLGRARFRSPFFRLLRLSAGQGYGVILAHNRRHLWHVRQLMTEPEFPTPSRERDG